MKIVQIARRFVVNDWGGTETVILEASKELLARGHQTELVCTLAQSNRKLEVVDGLPIRRLPYFYPYVGLSKSERALLDKKGGSPFSFALMRWLERCNDVDLIHLHVGNRLGGIGRRAALRKRIPYVISVHGGQFELPEQERQSLATPTQRALEWGKVLGLWVGARQVFRDAAAVICVGANEHQAASAQLPNQEVVYLPNGVNVERFASGNGARFRSRYGIAPDAYVVLVVARIDTQKNQLLAVRALKQLVELPRGCHLVLLGSVTNADYAANLERLASETGVSRHLTIIPGVAPGSDDLVDAYHSADVFLLPSLHEPFGIVILEAWAAGLPVVAARVGGIPSFVDDEVEGLLFESGDCSGLVAAVARVQADAQVAGRLAELGKKKAVNEYGWSKIGDKLLTVYERAIRSKTR